jgi:aminomethyltransferase
MLKRTPLFEIHVQLGARMVEFGGWEMPVQYSGIVDEHLAVRHSAGLFDISHMGQFRVRGKTSLEFLNQVLTNDLRKTSPGQGQYTLLCNETGGVIDDLYAYHTGETEFILMVNASRLDTDWAWLQLQRSQLDPNHSVALENRSPHFGALAVQGPRVVEFVDRVFAAPPAATPTVSLNQLKKNQIGVYRFGPHEVLVARTGYTGEDGFELMAAADILPAIWRSLMQTGQAYGLKPAGLGARDTLRTEVGYPLYGHELDEKTTPLEAGLGRFIGWDKNFTGREALLAQKEQGVVRRRIAFKLIEKGPPPRPHYEIWSTGEGASVIGVVASGTQSPSLGIGIGMGFVPPAFAQPGTLLAIEIRGKRYAAEVTAKTIFQRPPIQ